MPVGEMCNRMSAAELCRDWPLYFATRARMAEREEERQRNQPQRTLG